MGPQCSRGVSRGGASGWRYGVVLGSDDCGWCDLVCGVPDKFRRVVNSLVARGPHFGLRERTSAYSHETPRRGSASMRRNGRVWSEIERSAREDDVILWGFDRSERAAPRVV
jgi:hypothetical protein